MKIAALSDIHGNAWALEAVFHDLERRKPDLIVNLGDSLYGPLDPMATFKIIRSVPMSCIAGNEDRLILEKDHENATLQYVLNEMDNDALWWLASLPPMASLEQGILMCHGTPGNDTEYLLEKVEKTGVRVRSRKETAKLLESVKENTILCGHSHLPGVARIPGRLIINPGSVGCPAFDDSHPFFHRMENHSPGARYAILEYLEGELHIEHVMVPYDHEKAAKRAMKSHRPDWAKWLRTGIA
jgi:putative phosphoesterase